MVCSVCGGSGHNKRTCIVRKIQDLEDHVPDHVKDQIVDFLTDHVSEEALITAIEIGSEVAIPFLGIGIRLGRHAWKLLSR